MYLGERIHRYVKRYFEKNNGKAYYPYPTVKQVARGLKISIHNCVEEIEACGELPLMLTSYYTCVPEPMSAHFVEIY